MLNEEIGVRHRAVSGLVLILLFAGVLTLAFDGQPAKTDCAYFDVAWGGKTDA